MAKEDPALRWIREEVEGALEGEVLQLEVRLGDDQVIDIQGRIVVDGANPEETRAFLEALAEEAAPGYKVRLEGTFASRDLPNNVVALARKHAQRPEDVYWVQRIGEDPLKVRIHARQQDKFLGKKRNRLQKLAEALRVDMGVEVEALTLGSAQDVSELRTLPDIQSWLTPLFQGSPIAAADVHTYKTDSNSQSIRLTYDAEVDPASLRGLAQRILLKTDVQLIFERRMSKARAREVIDAALGALGYVTGYHISFQERNQCFVVTADAEFDRKGDLEALAKRMSTETETQVVIQIDVDRDVMSSRLVGSFPEDGIITGMRHIDNNLYEVEALIPFDDSHERLNAWSDEVEQQWGAKLIFSDPFLRAPDLRYRHLFGEDMDTIATRYNRPKAFPPEVLAEAEAKAVLDIEAEAKLPWRHDIRDLIVLSIDPERTKDIDDALSVVELEPGIYEVGVHIADVAHFIEKDGPMDQEALRRSFTTYLKEGEIPVLPFVLSNGACSLHGDSDRLAMSVFMKMNEDLDILDVRVQKTLIHNHCRFAYAGAQKILNGQDPEHRFAWHILTLGRLSQAMRKKRKESGALDLSIEVDPDKASHQLIEEFMLQANECVGRYLREQHPAGLCLYRTHPDVMEVSFDGLNHLAERFRFGITIRNQSDMQQALEIAFKTEYFDIFRFHVGRTLDKAVYHVEQLGHGALAKEDYAHFTSPIRRYTDLIIHRLIEDVLFREERQGASSYEKEEMRSAIDHINHMEIRVDAASFESHRLAELQKYDGSRRSYRGRILSFMRGWISIKLFETDLLVKVRYRDFTATDLMPVSINDEWTGQWYSLGDEVTVMTDGVDWSSKSIKARLGRGGVNRG